MKDINHILVIVLLGILIISCNKQKVLNLSSKQYQYIETVEKTDLSGNVKAEDKDPEEITAQTDSDAYCQAYDKFCVSLKVEAEMEKNGVKPTSHATTFKLLDSNGKDISESINFANKEKILETIKAEVLGIKLNSVTSSVQQTKEESIDNGSHEDDVWYAMKERIKAQMKDADSFEELSHNVTKLDGQNYEVTMTFKGTNTYGAIVTSTATAKAKWTPEITKIYEFNVE